VQEIEDSQRNRRLPDPIDVAWLPAIASGPRSVSPSDFIVANDRTQPKPDHVAAFPIVTFGQAVSGPIALGYGAHFGLGLLVPLDAEPPGCM
jgi:CRISPR-associated protein Csb2